MCIFKKKIEIPPAGCVPSPVDKRDIMLSAVQAPIPLNQLPENFIIPYKLTILYQNGDPACVGFSGASLKAEKERREGNLIDFEGLWLYKECKKIDGMPNLQGTWIRILMKVLKDIGAKPLNQLETEAPKYRIGGYARVDDATFEGLKRAINQNGVLIAGFVGSNQGWQSAYVRQPNAGEQTWGHAVALIGFNKDYVIAQNSWGASWGNEGLFYIPKDYIESSNFMEAWTCLVDLPDDFVTIPKPVHAFTTNLKQGDKNDEVIWLQKCLKYLGVFPQIIDATGFYGTITVQAAKLFQTSYGLPVTGAIGSLDRAKLNSIFF